MRHVETRLCSPELSSGHFFCPPTRLPSSQWGVEDTRA